MKRRYRQTNTIEKIDNINLNLDVYDSVPLQYHENFESTSPSSPLWRLPRLAITVK